MPGGPVSPWQVVALALAGGSGAAYIVPQVAPGVVRPDAWTGAQAAEAQRVMRAAVARTVAAESIRLRREWALDIREAEARAEEQRPPAATQTRILALEAGVANLHRLHGEQWAPGASHFAEVDD